jgi:hypothetical protein
MAQVATGKQAFAPCPTLLPNRLDWQQQKTRLKTDGFAS